MTIEQNSSLTAEKYMLLDAAQLINTMSPHIADALDLTIDLLLLTSNALEEGSAGRTLNEELTFSETKSDPLGNPLQIRIRTPKKIYFSPEVSDILADLCQALVVFRDTGNTEDFFEALAAPYSELAPKRLRNRLAKAESDLQDMNKDLEALYQLENTTFEENKTLRKRYNQLESDFKVLQQQRNKLKKLAYSGRHKTTPLVKNSKQHKE
jgi:hypothetical protein